MRVAGEDWVTTGFLSVRWRLVFFSMIGRRSFGRLSRQGDLPRAPRRERWRGRAEEVTCVIVLFACSSGEYPCTVLVVMKF